jgi:predicted KAP-like P-loop ATPase
MTSPPEIKQPNWFSADRPILTRAEDQLSRSHFADSIAKAVEGWTGKDSLVLALYGRWGMGKTSIKNMILDSIRSKPRRKVEIAEFNPWEVANRDQLTELFFDELSIALGKGEAATSEIRKRLVNRLRRYAIRLKAGADLTGLFVKGMTWMLVAAGALAIAVPFLGKTVTTIFGVLSLAVAIGLLFASNVASSLAELLGAAVGSHRKSLREIKDELVLDLAQLPHPLLVVLDDADRLTPNELQQLFQLVKVNADFPNVVYLLILDRQIAAEHLGKVLSIDGNDYLEKIVQIPFDVPVLSRSRLQKILFGGLNQLLADCPESVKFDKGRWGNLFVNVLQYFFENLRQVNRFLSTFSFHLAIFRNGTSLEVNPVDLITIEALRIFEPKVYRAVAANKDLLTSTSSLAFYDASKRTSLEEAIAAQASDIHKDKISELLKQLFPLFGTTHSPYSTIATDQWQRELRVCAKAIFDRYFHFSILEGDISQVRIDALLAAAGDRNALREQFLVLDSEKLLELAIDRLDAYKESIPIEHALPFTTALFDIGDRLSNHSEGMFGLSPLMHGSRIVRWYLKLLPSPEERANILKDAISATSGLGLPVHFVMIQQQAADKPDQIENTFVSPGMLNELKLICVKKIEAFVTSGKLEENAHLIDILYRWKQWANSDDVKAWCNRVLDEDEGVLKLLRGFMMRSIQITNDGIQKENWFLRLKYLEDFVSLERVNQQLEKISANPMTAEDTRVVDAYRDAATRRAQGKKEFGEDPFEQDA